MRKRLLLGSIALAILMSVLVAAVVIMYQVPPVRFRLPSEWYSWEQNKAWLDGAIDAGKSVKVPWPDGIANFEELSRVMPTTAEEIRYLMGKGYKYLKGSNTLSP